MKKPNLHGAFLLICSTVLLAALPLAQSGELGKQWEDPFPSGADTSAFVPEALTLDMALARVAQFNSSLEASRKQRESALESVGQANLRPNPELELEAENVGGDLTGFRESEMTILLSQDLELWGQRGARRKAALRDMEAVSWETRADDFDIYAETKLRFYALLHAQRKLELAQKTAELTSEVAEAVGTRVQKGAALTSEHLLAKLNSDRARMEVALGETELKNAQRDLVALWRGEINDIKVIDSGSPLETLPDLTLLKSYLGQSREVVEWRLQEASINALLNLEKANRLPSPTVSGGYKRSEAEDIGTFLVGLAIPIPLFNRNQGNISSLHSQSEALNSAQEQAMANAEAELEAIYRNLGQLLLNRASLDTLILPEAEEAYLSLKRGYEMGRIPYSTLLEGEQGLIQVRFELNDLDLTIRQESTTLEQLLGISLRDITINQGRK